MKKVFLLFIFYSVVCTGGDHGDQAVYSKKQSALSKRQSGIVHNKKNCEDLGRVWKNGECIKSGIVHNKKNCEDLGRVWKNGECISHAGNYVRPDPIITAPFGGPIIGGDTAGPIRPDPIITAPFGGPIRPEGVPDNYKYGGIDRETECTKPRAGKIRCKIVNYQVWYECVTDTEGNTVCPDISSDWGIGGPIRMPSVNTSEGGGIITGIKRPTTSGSVK